MTGLHFWILQSIVIAGVLMLDLGIIYMTTSEEIVNEI